MFVSEATRYVDQLFALVNPTDAGISQEELGPARVSAIQPKAGAEPHPWARMVGLKLRHPQTAAEQLLAEADFAEWRANTKTDIPELDRVINERVYDYLEQKAKYFLDTPRWKNASLVERKDFVRDILKGAQEDVRSWIDEHPGSFEHLVKARRDITTQPERLRKQAKEALGISDIPDRQLTFRQMEEMKVLLDLYKDHEKTFTE